MNKGIFITFEGGEGSGKTTQIRLLAEALTQAGYEIMLTREPGGTESAEALRRLLVEGKPDAWDAVSETLLFLAARRNHIKQGVEPALAQGKIVLCDRFLDSTLVYQGISKNLGMEYVQMLSRLALGNVQPDITLLLDIPAESGLSRAQGRNDKENRFEALGDAFHAKVRAGFLQLVKAFPSRIIVINANAGIDAVHQAVLNALHERTSLLHR